jgi:glutamine cyclotransferase
MNGESSVREVDLETGIVRRKKMLAHADFAEGITRFGDRCANHAPGACSFVVHLPGTTTPIIFSASHASAVTVCCRLFQLTWQSPKMFSYKVDTLEQVRISRFVCVATCSSRLR